MDTKKLRQKILDLAIRGKLVPQDPNDEPASVLLERIREKKKRLVKEGKLKKKDFKETPISEDDIPFEIPDSWEWVRIGSIFSMQAGKNITAADIKAEKSEKFPYQCYGGNGLRGYVAKYNTTGCFPLVGRQGALCGNVNIAEGNFWATEHAVVTNGFGLTEILWQFYFLTALNLNKLATATAQPGLAVSNVIESLIPLPPLAEQKRIANAVERWFTLIDELESNEGDLLKAIDKAKSKILDLAIHGKLVPQDPNDEPAIELLKRINPKFESCDKENCSFELPNCWEWTTIGEIASSILYGVSESAKDSGNYKLLRITDIQNNKVNWQTVPFTDFDDKKALPYLLQDGDILFARTGATVGKSYLVEGLSQPSIYASYLIRVQTSNLILPSYIKMFFDSGYYWEQITMNSVGIGQPNVNGTILAGLAIPIPPYQEQLRIVAKIEELFAVLDSIKESLK